MVADSQTTPMMAQFIEIKSAKAEIWQEMPKFRAAADKMIGEVAKLDIAAKSGNLDQIKSAVGAVGQSCKACHDNFRAERK